MKQINKILIIAALSMLFWYTPSRAQENNGTLLDSLSEGDDLLDSNLVYKEMYDDSLKDQGNWVKIVKSDFIKDVNGTDTELDDLSTSGNDDYVYVWRPYEMGYNPYVNGRWVFTYDGWIWVSNYFWGWTCYHYGRWWWSPAYGWVWLPGRVWAPNWCYWRDYGGYYGWHPYGPRIHWRTHHGWHHNHVVITHPTKWVFVSKKKINENITKRDVLKTNLKDVVKNSTRINNINTFDEKVKIKYTGPDVTEVSANTGKKINPELISTVRTKNDQEIKKNTFGTKDETNNGTKSSTNYNGDKKSNRNKSTESGNNGSTYNGKKESNRNNESTRSSDNGNRESTRSGNNGSRESTRSGNNGSRESTRSGNSGNNGSTKSGNSGNNGSRSTNPKKVSENNNQNSSSSSDKNSYTKKESTYTPPKKESTYTPPKSENTTRKETYNPPKQENTVKRESNSTYRSDTGNKKESSNNNTSVRKK